MFESAVLPEKPPYTEKIIEIRTDFLTVRKTSVHGEIGPYQLNVYESLKNLHKWRRGYSQNMSIYGPTKNLREIGEVLFISH